MHIFPKQYTQTKAIPCAQNSSPSSFFFLPEQYSAGLHVDQLFRLFILDALHCIAHGDNLSEGYFLPLCTDAEFSKHISFAQKQLKKFGLSSLMDTIHTPLDLTFRYDLQDFFVYYFSQGIFFEDRFIVYWSNLLKSPVSGDFLEFIAGKKNRYTLKYFVSTKNNSLNVITDSPETIFGDVALAIHPQHKKAKVLKGQEAIIPIINKTIPIIIDERADFTRYGGVYRVSPGHDKIGLEIAKDHNLPIDTYAIDEHGLFTEHAGLFAGKPVEDFFSNIIQNLGDIGNLITTEEVDASIPTCKQSGEVLTPHCWKGLFVKLPEEHLLRFLEQDQIASLGLSKDYITNSYWLASSCQRTGIDVPLWKTERGIVPLNTHWFLEQYSLSKQSGSQALGIFLLFVLSHNLLPQEFSLENLVSFLFDHSAGEDLAKLFDHISAVYPKTKKEFAVLSSFIGDFAKEQHFEKITQKIAELLDEASYLQKLAHSHYRFAFDQLDPTLGDICPYNQNICPDFSTILLLINKYQSYGKPLTLSASQDFLKTAIKNLAFAEYHIGESFLEKLHILPLLRTEKEGNHFPLADIHLLKNYHADCIRISFLSLADGKNIYQLSLFAGWDLAIAKFWNACRYVKVSFFDSSKSLSYTTTQKYIHAHIDSLSAFDGWIISKLSLLLDEYQQISRPEHLGRFVHHLFHFLEQDFSLKYLELIKSAPSEHSQQVSLCVIQTAIAFLKPYLPNLTRELSHLFCFKDKSDFAFLANMFESIQKNYSISLFMEIIDKFSEIKASLGLKKHDKVCIFIRSNPDFIKFAKSNESLFCKTLHAEEICYLVHHDEIPCGYKKEDIIDISVGLKAIGKAAISGIPLLQKQLQEKEEYLQHLKHLVQQLSASGADNTIISVKKQEITCVKETIEQLQFEITTCKTKG